MLRWFSGREFFLGHTNFESAAMSAMPCLELLNMYHSNGCKWELMRVAKATYRASRTIKIIKLNTQEASGATSKTKQESCSKVFSIRGHGCNSSISDPPIWLGSSCKCCRDCLLKVFSKRSYCCSLLLLFLTLLLSGHLLFGNPLNPLHFLCVFVCVIACLFVSSSA